MDRVRIGMILMTMILLCASLATQAQQSVAANPRVTVPSLVSFSGVLTDANRKPRAGVTGVTFLLYEAQQGGAPLWMETQNVQPNGNGHYTVLLGSTKSDGLPKDLFASGQARWLAVQVQGQDEQPRILILSVPYALKAADADTLGGMPASAFLQSNAAAAPTQSSFKAMPAKATPQNNASLAQSAAISGTGTTNFIPLWKSSTTLGSSVIYQSANGMLGVGTKAPKSTLDVHSTGTAAKILVAEDSAGNQRLSVDVHGNVNVVTDAAGTAIQVKGPLSPLNHARGVVNIQQNQTYAVTLNWSFPFPDTNYTVSCTPVSSGYTGSGEYLLQVTSISPTSVQVEIAAYVGGDISIHCIGVHD